MSPESHDTYYMTALGLDKDPFSPEPNSLYYYFFDSFEQRLKILSGLVQGTDIFVLVIGEPGSGKTTLLNRYLAATDAEWRSARILADPATAATQSSESRAPNGYPVYVLQDSADPTVIVDDAHHLPQRDLEFLIQEAMVPGGTNKIKRLVLFGESDLYTAVTRLAASLTAQPAVNKIYLPGLTTEQTAAYLHHRLKVAGYSGESPFSASDIEHIHQISGGYPGPIIEIARQLLNQKKSPKKKGPDMLQNLTATPRRLVTWTAAGVFIIIAALWLLSDRQSSAPRMPDKKSTNTVFREKIVQNHQTAGNIVTKKIAAAIAPVTPPAAIETGPNPAPQPPTEAPQPLRTEQAREQNPLAAEPFKTEPPPAATPVMPQAGIAAAPQKDPPPRTVLQPKDKHEPETAAPVVAKKVLRAVRREEWLLSQDASSWTIQVIGVSNESSLENFIKKNRLLQQSEIAYYESSFKGKPWYQLLYGIYPTRQEAELTISKLPEDIRRTGPWIRKLSAVQKAIQSTAAQ